MPTVAPADPASPMAPTTELHPADEVSDAEEVPMPPSGGRGLAPPVSQLSLAKAPKKKTGKGPAAAFAPPRFVVKLWWLPSRMPDQQRR